MIGISIENKTDNALSVVIGVVLLVAITIMIIIAFNVYTSGIVGTSLSNPSVHIDLKQDDTNNILTVIFKDQTNIFWSDVTVRASDDTTLDSMGIGKDIISTSFNPITDEVTLGDKIYITDTQTTITVVYNPTNTLLSIWEFT